VRDDTERGGDVLRCSGGYEGSAELGTSRTFLQRQAGDSEVGLMARSVRLNWDGPVWSESPRSRKGKTQRGAHKPEYRRRETRLRGDGVATVPTGGIHPSKGE
jgi:hypothetical protein